MKVIVLGGFGFLGQHVVSELRKKGYQAIALSRRNNVDVTNTKLLTKILKKESPYAIINCAAHVGSLHSVMKYPAEIIKDNTQIITSVYEAMRLGSPKTKIVNPMANCSYPGEANIHYEPDWQAGPVHESVLAFASTRRLIYAFAQCYQRQYGINSINWLIGGIYGPGDYTDTTKVHALDGIIIRLICAQRKKDKEFEIWGSGKPLREWVFVSDVAKILVDSLKLDKRIYPLNIAQNKGYSIYEIAKIGAKCLKYSVKFVFNTKYADGAMIKVLDDRQFRAQYPAFKFTPLKVGIKKTIEYYKKEL